MSEKTAKIARKEGQQVVASISIIALKDGSLSIEGIPLNALLAMEIMGMALKVMAVKIHEMNQNQSNILKVKSPILAPDGRRFS